MKQRGESKIIRRSQIKKSKSKKSQKKRKKRVTQKQRRKRRNGGSGNGTQAPSTGTRLQSIPEAAPRTLAELALTLASTLHEDPTPQQIEQVRATLVQRLAPTTPSS